MRREALSRSTRSFLCRLLAGICLLLLLFAAHAPSASAQMWGYLEPGQNPKVLVNASSLYQPDTHVQGGGTVTVSRYSLAARTAVPINDDVSVGFGLTYEFDDYNFSKLSGLPVPDPWNKIDRVGVTTRISYRLNPEWSIFAAPVGQFSGEEGADFGRSLIYGGVGGAMYRPSSTFMIGFGAGVFYRLEETSFFPALIFSWKITDRLRLGNSFRTGPSGPAGLELAYTFDSERIWETAISGGYRTYRFRLESNGPVPNGIGQTNAWPFFARLSRKIGSHLRADLYAGESFGGKLRLEDSQGHEIDQVSYNTAFLCGLSLNLLFDGM